MNRNLNDNRRIWRHLNKSGHILNWTLKFPDGQSDPELQHTSLLPMANSHDPEDNKITGGEKEQMLFSF